MTTRTTLWAWVRLARPSDSALAFAGTYIGARLADVPEPMGLMVTAVAVSNGLLSAASMMLNDWQDVVEDRINRPDRPIPSGLVTRDRALIVSIVLFGLAVAIAAQAGLWFGLGAAGVCTASAAYTLRMKTWPWIGNALCALLSSYPLWCWLPLARLHGSLYLTVAIAFFVMGIGREVIRTAFDTQGDQASGVRTVATTMGPHVAIHCGTALMVGALLAGWIPVIRSEASQVYIIMLTLSTILATLAAARSRRLPSKPSSARLILVARAVIVLMLIALASACGGRGPSGPTKPTIAVIPRGSTQLFWRGIREGATKAGEDLGATIAWPGVFKEGDLQAQISAVTQAITAGATALALAPDDEGALADTVATVKAAGIPVAIIDGELSGDDYITTIGTNDFEAGQAAARRLATGLNGQGRVALLRLDPTVTTTTQREEGFLQALAAFPDIHVVNQSTYAGSLLEHGYRTARELLKTTGAREGQLDAVFCSNESTTLGMMKALEDAGLSRTIQFYGFDRTPRLVNALTHGEVQALVLQDSFRIGYLAVSSLLDHLAGKPVERRQWVTFAVADRETLSDPFVQQLLGPMSRAGR